MVQRFWKIEAEGTLLGPNEDSSLENLAVQTMGNSICYNDERYQSGPPWEHVKKLHKNYFSAVSQPNTTKDPSLNQKYKHTLSTDLDKKFCPTSRNASNTSRFDMVFTSSSSNWSKQTSKRDESCQLCIKVSRWNLELKSSNLTNLLNNLVGVLLIFREHTVAVLSHIEGMFMQIAVRQENQSTLCFLWMIDNNIRLFLFTRKKFVARCS